MFDAKLRPLIDRTLDPVGRWLVGFGVGANHVTVAGAFLGLLAFIFFLFGTIGVTTFKVSVKLARPDLYSSQSYGLLCT